MIDIKGLDKADVLKALYDNSQLQGSGFLQAASDDVVVTVDHCRELLQEETYFDYLYGRVMKVDLTSDDGFEEWLYDRDNGAGTAQKAIDSLR